MPCYPKQFAESIKKKQEKFLALFSPEPKNQEESWLKEEVLRNWHKFPSLSSSSQSVFAVDGSNACLALQGGRYISIVQAVLQGKEWREIEVDAEVFRDTANVDVERFHQIHRQWLEWKIARENAKKMTNGILFLDGSLYISPVFYSWTMIPQRMPEGLEEMPLLAMNEFLSLVNLSIRHNLQLVGISKTSKSHFYPRRFLNKDVAITDSEIFTFWTSDPGYSTPLLVGPYFIPQPWERVKGEFLKAYQSELSEKVGSMLDELLPSLSVIIFFVRFEEGDEVYRVDVLSSSLNYKVKPEELKDMISLEPQIVHPLLSVLLSSHGGFNVYHNLLYVAHNEVMLREKDQDVYMSLLRELVQLPIRRSKVDTRFGRRF